LVDRRGTSGRGAGRLIVLKKIENGPACGPFFLIGRLEIGSGQWNRPSAVTEAFVPWTAIPRIEVGRTTEQGAGQLIGGVPVHRTSCSARGPAGKSGSATREASRGRRFGATRPRHAGGLIGPAFAFGRGSRGVGPDFFRRRRDGRGRRGPARNVFVCEPEKTDAGPRKKTRVAAGCRG